MLPDFYNDEYTAKQEKLHWFGAGISSTHRKVRRGHTDNLDHRNATSTQ